MKKNFFKLSFSLLLIVGFLFVLSSCGGSTLATPSGVQVSEQGLLTWNEVEDAEEYVITINDTEYRTSKTSYDLSKLSLENGAYQVFIKAVTSADKIKNSAFSAPISYVVGTLNKLVAPNNVRVEEGIIKWSAVANATKYDVKVGTITKTVTATSIALSSFGDLEGKINISVKAIGNELYLSSDFSNPITYRLELSLAGLRAAIYEHYLEKDYPSEAANEQTDYIYGLLMDMNEWAELDNTELLDFFYFGENLNNFDTPIDAFKGALDLGLEDEQIANLLRAYLMVSFGQVNLGSVEYYEDEIASYENLIASITSQYNQILFNLAVAEEVYKQTELYQLRFARNEIYQEILTAEENQHVVLSQLSEELLNIYYQYDFSLKYDIEQVAALEASNPWLLELKPYIVAIINYWDEYEAIDNLIFNAPDGEKEKENDYNQLLNEKMYFEWDELYAIRYYERQIEYYQERIADLEVQLFVFEKYFTYLAENKEQIIEGIVPLIKFARFNLENVLETLMELIESENITAAELVVLRDELVNSIFDSGNLPTETEVEKMLALVKDLSLIYLEAFEELRTAPYDTFYDDVKLSIDALEIYFGEIYLPYLEIIKEVLMHATVEEFEALLSGDELSMMNAMMSFITDLSENPLLITNTKLINDLTIDLILSGDLKILPYLLAREDEAEFALFSILYQIIIEDSPLITEAFDELMALVNVEYFELLFDLLLTNMQNVDPEDLFLALINFEYLKDLTADDVDAIVQVAKKFLIERYLMEEAFTLSREELEEILNTGDLCEALSIVLNLGGEYFDIVRDFYERGLLVEYDYEVIIQIAIAIDEFYSIEKQAKLDLLYEIVELFMENEVFLDETELDYVFESLIDLILDVADLFGNAKIFALYDAQNLTEMQKQELIDFVNNTPIGEMIEREYRKALRDYLGVSLFYEMFENYVSDGKYCSIETTTNSFTLTEIAETLGWEIDYLYRDWDNLISFNAYKEYGNKAYFIYGEVDKYNIIYCYWYETSIMN